MLPFCLSSLAEGKANKKKREKPDSSFGSDHHHRIIYDRKVMAKAKGMERIFILISLFSPFFFSDIDSTATGREGA